MKNLLYLKFMACLEKYKIYRINIEGITIMKSCGKWLFFEDIFIVNREIDQEQFKNFLLFNHKIFVKELKEYLFYRGY